jgi:CTP:molybdopterin cytidylyltransferase MocA
MSVAIVPAAGKAERFGGGKLTADVGGEPLLNRTLRALLDGGVGHIIVVLAPNASLPTVTLLNDERVVRVVNPDPSRGMFSSIQIGLMSAEGDPILVLPADMPFVQAATVRAVAAEARRTDGIVSPSHQGRHGHPVAFPLRLKNAVLQADPASTLNDALKRAGQSVDVNVDDRGVRRDVDRPGDLG